METIRLRADPAGIDHAARLLKQGEVVAFPTETVYGLGADATNGQAVARIFEAKGRPSFNPLIVHVASRDDAQALVRWSDVADLLATTFWPGPLTLVLPVAEGSGLSPLVTAGLPSVGIRVPEHSVARALLRAVDRPIAAPSANPSGKISPTSAGHVLARLPGRIAAVLDDGPCEVGLESTIIGLTDKPRLLRLGGLPVEAVEQALGRSLDASEKGIIAPGQLLSHYAPGAPLRLGAEMAEPGESHLGFGSVKGDLSLSPSGDLHEAAANLFGHLHKLDSLGRPIAVAPVPEIGLGRAINDRLRRAAAPRS